MKCKYGFYTCSFIGQASFCSECEDGSNYQENYMKKVKKKSAGGKRPGAGRPKGEPTAPLNLRVPVKHKKHLVKLIKDELIRIINYDSKD